MIQSREHSRILETKRHCIELWFRPVLNHIRRKLFLPMYGLLGFDNVFTDFLAVVTRFVTLPCAVCIKYQKRQSWQSELFFFSTPPAFNHPPTLRPPPQNHAHQHDCSPLVLPTSLQVHNSCRHTRSGFIEHFPSSNGSGTTLSQLSS